nr:DUF547 domain-containing protein [Veronia pacifica]
MVAHAAPKSDLWPFWNQSNEASTVTVSHDKWQQLLDRYLVKEGQHTLFRYSTVSQQDNAQLQDYINSLTLLDPRTLNKAQQYAYWANLYNAVTVKLILDNYPLKSIKKLGGLFSFGPWDDDVVSVVGKTLTLNDIEHRILRPIWNDPRTHYVINCASLGCPNLPPQALTASNSEQVREVAAQAFINSQKGVMPEGKQLELSSIYEWFASDFGNNEKAVLEHIQSYSKNPDIAGWSGKIKYRYDWNLNEKK